MFQEKHFTATVGEHEITVSTGKLARLAGGSVTYRTGDCVLLTNATMSKEPREGLNFFPLMVEFEEKLYAAGRIPGSFFRREGRPSTASILISRLTDRPLRPLFPDGMRNEVQVITMTLSSDSIHHLDIMAINAASFALTISNIPWNGPIAAIRVGLIDGEFVADPTIPQMAESTLDLRLAGSKDAIIMVEAGANEVSESVMVEALAFGHSSMQPLIDLQMEMRETIGKEKSAYAKLETDSTLAELVKERLGGRIKQIVAEHTNRDNRNEAVGVVRQEVVDGLIGENDELDPKAIREIISKVVKNAIRDRILYEGIRPDGRDYTTVRELDSEVTLSPRAHGSGLFTRGETQVLSIVALGTPREAQRLDGLYPQENRRIMHHYNFPPYSVGETWPLRGTKRREIGHGALAERALIPVIPSEESFPYTIRIVSEVLSSNGSTSQASICASSLALMDSGVPITRPVGGVAMGLVTDGEKFAVLTDIQGLEDHLGDMDFKVAGTTEGITALQMDIKISGLSQELMAQALQQAHEGRMQILKSMTDVMPSARSGLSKWAPRMESVSVDPEKIGAIIGKGGATIRALEETFGVSIDIQDDGTVFVAGVPGAKTDEAIAQIEIITTGPKLGDIYTGKVVRVTDFAAFVELVLGLDGMLHISQIASERIKSVTDAVQMGDELMVMVTDVDKDTGKVRLSRQAVLEGWTLEEARSKDRAIGGDLKGGRGRDKRGRGRRRD